MKKTLFLTLGCKLNQVETDHLTERLSCQGVAVPVQKGDEEVEMVVINTCAVTDRAVAKSRHLIAETARRFPNAEIVAAGCLAQLAPEMLAKMERVKYVVGTSARFDTEWWRQQDDGTLITVDDPSESPVMTSVGTSMRNRPRLKIQDGCDQFCTYCIIPSLRGKPRSVPENKVIEVAGRLIERGAAEIVLTGVRIGSYGSDLTDGSCLADLLQRLTELPGDARFRLGSLEPWEVNGRIVDLVVNHPRVCRHLHVPMQHTHPAVLERMGRPVLGDAIHLLRDAVSSEPELALGTDIIIGFPGETEDEFASLLETVSSLPLAYIHQFTFSVRPGVPAAEFPGKLSDPLMKFRSDRFYRVNQEKRRQFAEKMIGGSFVAIPDRIVPGKEWVQGVTDNYLRLKLPVAKLSSDSPVRVTVAPHPIVGLVGTPC